MNMIEQIKELAKPKDREFWQALHDLSAIWELANLEAACSQTVAPGEPVPVDGKFGILGGGLVNLVSREPVPKDEPLFLLRARDHHAYDTLMHYRALAQSDCNELHLAGIEQVIRKFITFANEHPERMKEPGKTRHLKLEAAPPAVSTPRCPSGPFNPANLEANAGLAATLWHQFCELTKVHEGNPPLDWWGFKWAAYAMAGLEALPRESQGNSEEAAFRKGMSRFKVTEQLWNEYRANRDDLPEFARLPVDTQLFAQYIVGSQFFQPASQPSPIGPERDPGECSYCEYCSTPIRERPLGKERAWFDERGRFICDMAKGGQSLVGHRPKEAAQPSQ